jgi:hypothetical protein
MMTRGVALAGSLLLAMVGCSDSGASVAPIPALSQRRVQVAPTGDLIALIDTTVPFENSIASINLTYEFIGPGSVQYLVASDNGPYDLTPEWGVVHVHALPVGHYIAQG